MRLAVFAVLAALVSVCASAGETKKSAPKAPAKPPRCAEMDYGPFLTASWGVKGNPTMKGVAVTLDKTQQAYAVFDTELFRTSVAWTGDYTDWQGLVFVHNWGKARGPNVTGTIAFQTKPVPAWDLTSGTFADPRPAKEGPLPPERGRYNGLYVHGAAVVFSYSVHGVEILERPAFAGTTAAPVFIRDYTLAPNTQPLAVVLADTPGQHAFCTDSAVKIETRGERLVAVVPASAAKRSFSVAVGASADAVKLKRDAVDLGALTTGGPARWTPAQKTTGTRGADSGAFAVDTVAIPDDNPWRAWMRLGALDFFSDGRAAVTTWSGDVWIVSGLDDSLQNVSWKRFASGLLQPLGIKIVNDEVYVLAHGPLLKLKDLNGDGEADFYENFNNDCIVTDNYHEFATELHTDANGDFYFLKGAPALAGRKDFERFTAHHGALLKVTRDGKTLTPICNGFREPNGLTIAPDGSMLVTDNQGNWTPECPLNLVRPGGFYGMVDPAHKGPPPVRDPALLWFPMNIDNSSGGGAFVTDARSGLPAGAMIHTSYGKSTLNVVLFDGTDAPGKATQAGVVKIPALFASGVMRPKFNPKDGQLYAVGLKGWGTNASKDGCFQRLRRSAQNLNLPVAYATSTTGLRLTFSDPLDAAAAQNLANYSAEGFNVVRSVEYGSPEFALSDPKKKAREPLDVKAVKLLPDGKTVELAIEGFRPMTNFVLKYQLADSKGTEFKNEFNCTLNALK